MWDRIPVYKSIILLGLKIRKVKFQFELALVGIFAVTALLLGFSVDLILYFKMISAVGFITHLLMLREIHYFKACKFYGLSGHEPEWIIKERLKGRPTPKYSSLLWNTEKR